MCIFCQIINQEIPCYRVYEDDQVLAFLDIKPVNPGHTLVVPKKHSANIEEINEADLTALILAVKKIGCLLKKKLGVSGYNMNCNNDPIAGQLIPHLHFHVIPRHEGDGCLSWKQSTYRGEEADKIIRLLTS